MRVRGERKSLIGRMSLTRQVALLSLLPMLALGLSSRACCRHRSSRARWPTRRVRRGIIAHIGIQPKIHAAGDLRDGLLAAGVAALDQQLSARSVSEDLARVKIWNAHHEVVYSDDHSLIGRTLTPSDDLLHALAGQPDDAEVVTPSPHSETASEVGLGKLVEVYVPLRFSSGRPAAGRLRDLSQLPPDRLRGRARQADDRAASGDRAGAAVGDPLPHRRAGVGPAASPGRRRTTVSPAMTS